jgi:hypothetical protein
MVATLSRSRESLAGAADFISKMFRKRRNPCFSRRICIICEAVLVENITASLYYLTEGIV